MRAVLGELAGVQDASEGGSDCRESRCLERDEYQGDLERKGWEVIRSTCTGHDTSFQ